MRDDSLPGDIPPTVAPTDGQAGHGEKPAPDLTGHVRHAPAAPADLRRVVENGGLRDAKSIADPPYAGEITILKCSSQGK